MRTLKSLTLLIGFFLSCTVSAQKSSEKITEELSIPNSASEHYLVVHNVNGPVQVEGYNGNTIQVEAEKIITAKNNSFLQEGKEEISLIMVQIGDQSYVYLDSPYTLFDLEKGLYNHGNYGNSHFEKQEYDYFMSIKIKVPTALNIRLNTMNDGDIKVQNVHPQRIEVNNLNGAITLDNISGQTYANALNQDINVIYKTAPSGESTFHSLNGDINVTVKSSLNADVFFKSLNGDFYTNLETTSLRPAVTTEKADRKGTKYKVGSKEQFRVGNGGFPMHFDVLNGNVTLKN